MYACVCPFVRLHVCVSVSFYLYVHICAPLCARVCDCAYACLPVLVRAHVRMLVRVNVPVYACILVLKFDPQSNPR